MSSLPPPAATRPTPAAYLATHVLGVTLFLACLAWWANASGWDLAIARALFNPALDDFPLHTNRWLELIGHRMVLALPIGIGLGAIAVAAASYRIPAWRSLRGPALALALTCIAGQLAITQLKHYTTLPRPYDLDTLGGYTPYPQSWWTWDRGKAGGALPSGHAGAGYSLLALYFAGWAVGRPGWRWWGAGGGHRRRAGVFSRAHPAGRALPQPDAVVGRPDVAAGRAVLLAGAARDGRSPRLRIDCSIEQQAWQP